MSPQERGVRSSSPFRGRTWGYEGRFFVEGDEGLLAFAYDAGLGERNSQGFGMFRVVETSGQ
ncbi:MAG: CRISPR-associated endoribonuclease Cas6 [Atribacterota bacterium]